MVILLMILFSLLLSTVLTSILFFFNDDSCLPHKRKLENMLDEIRMYQRKRDDCDVEIDYKGKHFNVYVDYDSINFYYHQYTVYINGKLVKTFHILDHLFSKSRSDEHHGDMRKYEEDEIIQAAYKFVKKANKDNFNKKWDSSSYFN